ncbi:glucokinase [Streptococcus varani]|uniref:Glucokinase n=1 Tax=Streptococcus varani TaxID=1608583 RepID=A0A0E4H312_9STRE|nr:ROK family glucokinase [Streptococcus varani]CQR24179.1 glucokinase [Streptococcus varani]
MTKKIIGIDLGGTSVKLAMISQEGEILEKWSIKTNVLDNGTHIVPDIISSIKDKLDLYQLTASDFIGIGMGSPGKVDAQAKTVVGAYNLGWSELQEVGKAFKEAFDLPFFIGNDANVAALGEQWKGAGQGNQNVVMFTLGTGVGGGIVVNGQLVTGEGGAAGEIGHLTVDTQYMTACTCGKKGCLEAVASATGIVNLTHRFSDNYEGESPIKKDIDNGDEVTSKAIFDAAKTGDLFANMVVDKFVDYLALAVSHIANTLSPSHIVIGGGVSAAGEFLREKIAQQALAYTFPQIRQTCQIVLAELGNDAGVIGAAQLVNTSR